MATDYLIPTAQELREVEQDLLPRLYAQDPIFEIFPVRESDDSVIAWEQKDNYIGLQQLRGLDGAPAHVKRTGAKRFVMEPGTYGEFTTIPEREITRRRAYGSYDQVINLSTPVAEEQARLLQRRLDRIRYIGWTLASTGTFSVSTVTGVVAHTDAYTTQTFSATVGWATSATATPLADFRSVKLLGRGHSVTFGAKGKAYMNSTTANRLYSNTNSADLYGRRTSGLGTFNSPDQINQLFMGDNLPQIVEYDEGYIDDSGTFQLFLPTGKVVVVGTRTNNAAPGGYEMTRNANNEGLEPGAYMKVIDRGVDTVPRTIEVHDGHNGGPVLEFPSSIVVMSV